MLLHTISNTCRMQWECHDFDYKGGFTLGSKTKETPTSSNPIGWEQNFKLKEFTLGSGFKVWKKEVGLMGHPFPVKSHRSTLKKHSWFEKPIFRPKVRSFKVCFGPKPDVSPPSTTHWLSLEYWHAISHNGTCQILIHTSGTKGHSTLWARTMTMKLWGSLKYSSEGCTMKNWNSILFHHGPSSVV
jgi:hypothetical protein